MGSPRPKKSQPGRLAKTILSGISKIVGAKWWGLDGVARCGLVRCSDATTRICNVATVSKGLHGSHANVTDCSLRELKCAGAGPNLPLTEQALPLLRASWLVLIVGRPVAVLAALARIGPLLRLGRRRRSRRRLCLGLRTFLLGPLLLLWTLLLRLETGPLLLLRAFLLGLEARAFSLLWPLLLLRAFLLRLEAWTFNLLWPLLLWLETWLLRLLRLQLRLWLLWPWLLRRLLSLRLLLRLPVSLTLAPLVLVALATIIVVALETVASVTDLQYRRRHQRAIAGTAAIGTRMDLDAHVARIDGLRRCVRRTDLVRRQGTDGLRPAVVTRQIIARVGASARIVIVARIIRVVVVAWIVIDARVVTKARVVIVTRITVTTRIIVIARIIVRAWIVTVARIIVRAWVVIVA